MTNEKNIIITKLDNKDYFSEIGNKIIGIIGYGNQGKSQALNLRDSGLNVIVGNVNDNYAKDAEKDGFKVYDIPEAVKKSDIIFLLIPDEIQKNIYKNHIEPNIKIGATLVFASGYNYFYGFIRPRSDITVLMIAPRMIGWGVRDVYVNDQGFPSLVAVGQDPNNNGYSILMTLCDRLGMFRKGGCAVLSSFKEETLVDLLSEHSWVGVMLYSFRAYYDVATELGASPASVILELYASGELAEIAKSMRDMGLFNQLKTHSRTSQYGQLTRGPLYITDEFKKTLKNEAINILNGTFAREWNDEENNGYIVYNRLHEMAKEHPMETEERKLYKILGR